MPKILCIEQRSPEWNTWRQDKIGASMVGTIMQLNPYETKYQLWERMINGTKVEINSAMQRGMDLEPIALQKVNEERREIGSKLMYAPVCMEHDEYPYMICSLDGYCAESFHPVLEIKCPGKRDHAVALMDRVPEHYNPQLQYQMYIAGCNQALYVSFDGENIVEVVVKRDDLFIEKMVSAVKDFYWCLINFTAPEICDRDLTEIVDSESVNEAEKLAILRQHIKELENHAELIEKRLIKRAGDKNCRIGSLRVIKVVRRGQIDYAKIDELKGLNLEDYRKPNINYWKIG